MGLLLNPYRFAVAGGAWVETWAQALDSDENNFWGSFTVRSLIPASVLAEDGTKVRIRLVCRATTLGMPVQNCFIGDSAGGGAPQDFATAPTRITFNGGNNGVTMAAGDPPVVSDDITFAFDKSVNKIVAIDLAPSASMRYKASLTNYDAYYKAAVDEAGTQNVTGYTNGNEILYFMNRMEVFQP